MDSKYLSPTAEAEVRGERPLNTGERARSWDGVRVWYVLPEELTAERWREASTLLSPGERSRWAKPASGPGPSLGAAARWLVRCALSHDLDVSPDEWEFNYLPGGRPVVKGLRGGPAPWFSLSHTDGMVVCTVARVERVGVDAERLTRRAHVLGSSTVLAASELGDLDKLDGEERARRQVELWTLKEAYAKATGVGLGLPFDSVAFHFDPGRVVCRVRPPTPGWDCGWFFGSYTLEGTHVVSLALERHAAAPAPEISFRRWFTSGREARA